MNDKKVDNISFTHQPTGELDIIIKGVFDFKSRNRFMQLCDNLTEKTSVCTVNLKDTTYIDSSGLGMLLILKNHDLLKDINIKLITLSNTSITHLIKQHNFSTFFEIISDC